MFVTPMHAVLATGRIKITGRGFGANKPVVTSDTTSLPVIHYTDTSIVALLPTSIRQGSYLPQLSNTTANANLTGSFYAMVEAVGPQGLWVQVMPTPRPPFP